MCVKCFLCFSKESKANFSKHFITGLSVVLKRYFILSVSLHNWISSVIILQSFWKNYHESLHLMSILVGNDAHPPLYLYIYHMFFSP